MPAFSNTGVAVVFSVPAGECSFFLSFARFVLCQGGLMRWRTGLTICWWWQEAGDGCRRGRASNSGDLLCECR